MDRLGGGTSAAMTERRAQGMVRDLAQQSQNQPVPKELPSGIKLAEDHNEVRSAISEIAAAVERLQERTAPILRSPGASLPHLQERAQCTSPVKESITPTTCAARLSLHDHVFQLRQLAASLNLLQSDIDL